MGRCTVDLIITAPGTDSSTLEVFEEYALEETGGGGEARNEEERGNKNEQAQGEIDGRRERRVEEEKEWKEGASRRRNE